MAEEESTYQPKWEKHKEHDKKKHHHHHHRVQQHYDDRYTNGWGGAMKMHDKQAYYGLLFVVILFGFMQYFGHCEVETLADFSFRDYLANFFNFRHQHNGVSAYELSMLFTMKIITFKN